MTDTPKPKRVDVIEKATRYRGYFQIDSYRLRHERFEGGMTDVMQREVFERGHAAAAVLYDPTAEMLVMIEQFRIGAHVAGWNPWMIEVVAGIIEAGETAEEVIQREAVEEANCEILDLIPLSLFQVSPGASTESIAMFCGRVDSRSATGVYGLDHEHEDIRVEAVPVNQVFEWLDDGRIVNATAMIGLWQFRHRHADIRATWIS